MKYKSTNLRLNFGSDMVGFALHIVFHVLGGRLFRVGLKDE